MQVDNGHAGSPVGISLGEAIHSILESQWSLSNKQEEQEMKLHPHHPLARARAVEAIHKHKELEERQQIVNKQLESLEKEKNEVEAELHRLSEIVPALKRKKVVAKAKETLAEFEREGQLIFKEQGDTTVCVDISYEEASVIDEYDVGIRKFTRPAGGVPKNHYIERVIAAYEALNKTIPSEFLNYYSIV